VKILVMDDAPEVRERIVELLAPLLDSVYQIIEAGDIVTALHLITEYKPPILILDLFMMRMHGSPFLILRR